MEHNIERHERAKRAPAGHGEGLRIGIQRWDEAGALGADRGWIRRRLHEGHNVHAHMGVDNDTFQMFLDAIDLSGCGSGTSGE